MSCRILGIGYSDKKHSEEQLQWRALGISFDFAASLNHAAEMLCNNDYICIVIRSEQITYSDILALRKIHSVPTIILPHSYTISDACLCANLCAMQYARASGHHEIAALGGNESVRHSLTLLPEQREPLTIVTVKDLSFCLEYRSIEIRGKEIELTEKEFDIFALLLSNPKKVFTYEMIMDAVWHHDGSFYSAKTVTTHISNLRKKLKIAPDVPEYIKSVRGVGYKFEVPR